MEKCNVMGIFLKDAQYKFEEVDRKYIEITFEDKIKIVEIDGNRAVVKIGRELLFDSKAESYVKANYEATLEYDEQISKERVMKDIESKVVNLFGVYVQISLLISQITNMSPYGPIVTPPGYDDDRIIIE